MGDNVGKSGTGQTGKRRHGPGFYAVARGRETGIFTSWVETKDKVQYYSRAVYKGFSTRQEAEQWLLVHSEMACNCDGSCDHKEHKTKAKDHQQPPSKTLTSTKRSVESLVPDTTVTTPKTLELAEEGRDIAIGAKQVLSKIREIECEHILNNSITEISGTCPQCTSPDDEDMEKCTVCELYFHHKCIEHLATPFVCTYCRDPGASRETKQQQTSTHPETKDPGNDPRKCEPQIREPQRSVSTNTKEHACTGSDRQSIDKGNSGETNPESVASATQPVSEILTKTVTCAIQTEIPTKTVTCAIQTDVINVETAERATQTPPPSETIEAGEIKDTLIDMHSEITKLISSERDKNNQLEKSAMESEISKLKEELKDSKNEVLCLKKEMQTKAVRIRSAQSQTPLVKSTTNGTQVDLEIIPIQCHCNEIYSDKEKELESIRGKHEAALNEISALKAKLRERETNVSDMQAKLIEANRNIISYQMELQAKTIDMTEKLSQLQQQIFEFSNVKTTEWTEVTHRHRAPMYSKACSGPPTSETPTPSTGTSNKFEPLSHSTRDEADQSRKTSSGGDQPRKSETDNKRKTSTESTKQNVQTEGKQQPKPLFFKGEGNLLSNFHPSSIKYKNMTYISVEQAYQHQKALHHKHPLADAILVSKEAKTIKEMGNTIRTDAQWDALKRSYPRNLVHNVASMFWGSGGQKGDGKNVMGKLLEKERARLMDGTNQRDDSTNSPDAVIIGHSHLKDFRPDKISGVKMEKKTAYTIDEASTLIQGEDSLPKTVFLHLVTNDVKSKSVQDCVADMKKLVTDIERKHKSKVVISLPPPVKDRALNRKIQAVNTLLQLEMECLDHYHSFTEWGECISFLYSRDGVHLSREGVKRLAYNVKSYLTWK